MPDLTAADVRDAAGLSYRQINGWDSKGALPGVREGRAGWRKFSARDVFAIMVCSDIRKRFGAPVESLGFVRSVMMQEGANHLSYAVEMMRLGLTVWLMTDLRETFVMDTDLEFTDMLEAGYFRGDHPISFIFVKINPIVNKLLGALKNPVQLQTKDSTYAKVAEARSVAMAQSSNEARVLKLVRDRDYRTVTIKMKDGEIVSAVTEAIFGGLNRKLSEEEVLKILDGGDYQTVTLTKVDGDIIRVNQSTPIPMSNSPAPKRAPPTPQKDPDRRGGHRLNT